jgi:uncharacterized membrane protein YbhN (UPF0104 family)
MAITEEERKFLVYWEDNRNKERKLINQLMFGLPIGILFSVPLIINFFLGKFWYKRADAVGLSQFNPTVLVLAVLLITVFVALLNRRFRWEKLEQQYLEIKTREKRLSD